MMKIVIIILVGVYLRPQASEAKLNEAEFRKVMKDIFEPKRQELCHTANLASWNYETDLTSKEKDKQQLKAILASAAFQREVWTKYFHDLDPNDYKDIELKRQAKFLRILGDSVLDTEKLTQFNNMINGMTSIYSRAKVCPFKLQNCILEKEGLSLEPEISDIMTKSRNYLELLYLWVKWRDATGAKMKDFYKTYVNLSNEIAIANDFRDRGEMWLYDFESPTFKEDIHALWKQIEPLYVQLHIYVGRKLKTRFGKDLDISDGLIPAHVFGNMWAQTWTTLSDLLKPFPDASRINGDLALKKNNYTILKLFQTADEFYQSLGLLPNDMSYDVSKGALIEKPTDGREVVCHASAWDLCDQKDFRIKMCTKVDLENFVVIHHEMGHIQYYLQYRNQSLMFRNGANPGFHEAIGDTIALSVTTPKHFEKIGLLTDYVADDRADLNSLMDKALEKIAFLPFGLLVDKFRWDVFAGAVQPEEWNSHWWNYREKYQRIKAPVPRSENDFDPGAKFHVASDTQYISYFVSHILQFQLYKSLCQAAGEYDIQGSKPLHQCDFYQSKRAGDKLSAGLSMGSSRHWSEALQAMTGDKELSAAPLLEYFQPLYEFLLAENSKYVRKSEDPQSLSNK